MVEARAESVNCRARSATSAHRAAVCRRPGPLPAAVTAFTSSSTLTENPRSSSSPVTRSTESASWLLLFRYSRRASASARAGPRRNPSVAARRDTVVVLCAMGPAVGAASIPLARARSTSGASLAHDARDVGVISRVGGRSARVGSGGADAEVDHGACIEHGVLHVPVPPQSESALHTSGSVLHHTSPHVVAARPSPVARTTLGQPFVSGRPRQHCAVPASEEVAAGRSARARRGLACHPQPTTRREYKSIITAR